jgi:hypothetical protein
MTTQSRAGVRELGDRLIHEYAGAIPPGPVLALAFRAERSLVAAGHLSASTRLEVCEHVVRRMLTDRLALRSGR